MELTQIDHDEIAYLIKEGCTSGILDREAGDIDNDGKVQPSYRISWDLNVNKFAD